MRWLLRAMIAGTLVLAGALVLTGRVDADTPRARGDELRKAATKVRAAQVSKAKADISNIETALDVFEIDCGRYPTAGEGLQALVAPPPDVPTWKGPYLKRLPADPWGRPYVYAWPAQHNLTSPDVWSQGEDPEDPVDDVKNWSVPQMFFTVDDGRTYFADDAARVPPFDRDGKQAVRALVFQCGDGKPFVGLLQRYTRDAKAKLENKRVGGDLLMEDVEITGLEIKKPGGEQWIRQTDPKAGRIARVTCPDGSIEGLRALTPE